MQLLKPVDGNQRITCGFDCHASRTPPSSAPGIDYAVPSGTPVKAAADGRVSRARYGGAGGKHVWLSHVGGRTLYAHLSALLVPEQTVVKAGDVIGLSGNTGHSTGPHLHFSFYELPEFNGGWRDPEPMVEDGE